MIRQLQEDNAQKDNLLKKAAEDMKFYKLELVNREESYNKMFGTNPNIGVLNPLGKQSNNKSSTSNNMGMMIGNSKPMAMGIGGNGIGGTGNRDKRQSRIN